MAPDESGYERWVAYRDRYAGEHWGWIAFRIAFVCFVWNATDYSWWILVALMGLGLSFDLLMKQIRDDRKAKGRRSGLSGE